MGKPTFTCNATQLPILIDTAVHYFNQKILLFKLQHLEVIRLDLNINEIWPYLSIKGCISRSCDLAAMQYSSIKGFKIPSKHMRTRNSL